MQSPSSFSVVALVLANLVPLAGVALGDWSIAEIVLLYWAESGIVGVFNLLKIVVVARWGALFFAPFFIVHYGGFMVGHLIFISAFLLDGFGGGSDALRMDELIAMLVGLWPALLALAASHGTSFVRNFIARREYRGRAPGRQMTETYRRIIVMHVTILVGGFLAMASASTLPVLALLVGLKILVDLRAHRRERQAARETDGAAAR